MLFQTPRLVIRPVTLADFDAFFEMQSNSNVMKYVDRKIQTYEECLADLKKVIQHYDEKKNGFWVWAVIRKSDNSFVGTAAIIVDENQEGEIGYRFLEKYWNNGYGLEVANGLVDYGFKLMKLKSIFAIADVLNLGSVKILEKTDLVFEKEEWNEKDECQDRIYRLKNPY